MSRSFYEELCNARTTVTVPLRTPPGEVKNAYCHVNSMALSAAQGDISYDRFDSWARNLSVRKLTGIQDSLMPTRDEYDRISRIFGNAFERRIR